MLQISEEPNTSSAEKRKAVKDIESDTDAKRSKTDECSNEHENDIVMTDENAVNSTVSSQSEQVSKETEPQPAPASEASKPKTSSKRAQRLAEKSIEHGTDIDPNLLPQSKYLSFIISVLELYFHI